MKIAAGIITDRGGRTSHAAIVARELGIPAIVGTESRDANAEGRNARYVVLCRGRNGPSLRRKAFVRSARRSILRPSRDRERTSCSTWETQSTLSFRAPSQ